MLKFLFFAKLYNSNEIQPGFFPKRPNKSARGSRPRLQEKRNVCSARRADIGGRNAQFQNCMGPGEYVWEKHCSTSVWRVFRIVRRMRPGALEAEPGNCFEIIGGPRVVPTVPWCILAKLFGIRYFVWEIVALAACTVYNSGGDLLVYTGDSEGGAKGFSFSSFHLFFYAVVSV